MTLTINEDIKLNVSRMDGSFAVATFSESGKDSVIVKAEFFEKSDLVMKFDSFLESHGQSNLIIRHDSFECRPEDYPYLTSILGTEFDKKTYVIVYQDYESTIDQLFEGKQKLLEDESKNFWEYKGTDEAKTAFITPTFQQFWNKYVDCLLYLHEKGYTHGAIEDLKRCVLLSGADLQNFKVIPSGKADIKEEDDLSGLSVMMFKLSPRYTCLYEEHARKFLTNSKRSVKDTLETLKKHPLLAPPSDLKKMVYEVSHIWGQNKNSRELGEWKFIGPFIAKMKRTEHYQLWIDQIEEWIECNEKRADQDLKSAKKNQIEECTKQIQKIKNIGACMRYRRTEYHNFSFVELVRYMNNKFKHAWERDGNNVPATFTEAEFIKTLIEIFPEIHVILFEYFYRSKSHFDGPYNADEKYPCEGYSVMQIDVRY